MAKKIASFHNIRVLIPVFASHPRFLVLSRVFFLSVLVEPGPVPPVYGPSWTRPDLLFWGYGRSGRLLLQVGHHAGLTRILKSHLHSFHEIGLNLQPGISWKLGRSHFRQKITGIKEGREAGCSCCSLDEHHH